MNTLPFARFFQDMAVNPFLLTGVLAGVLASVACGAIGPYVITRRIVFLSGAIAHTAVAGVGATIWLRPHLPAGLDWFEPIHGALVVALLSAVALAVVHDKAAERLDTLIGAMWAVGMAIGILLIKLTPGYQTELMSYLFGNLAYVSWQQIGLMAVLDVIILVTLLFFQKRLLAVCLDPQQAQLQGVNVLATNIVLLCLVALTAICLTQVVGLILVIALLTLPAATAAHHQGRLSGMIVVATLLCVVLTTLPRMAVYGTPISAEASIVLAAGAVYLLSVLIRRIRNRPRSVTASG
jgi:zinc transport system permease protein